MTKFVHVTNHELIPSKLEKGEIVINSPSFLEEVRAMIAHKPSTNITTTHFLRAIATEVGRKYDPKFNSYTHITVNDYTGIEFNNDFDLAIVVRRMILSKYPQMVDRYLEKKIKERPLNTKLIWFFGDWQETRAFCREGIDNIELHEVDQYMGRKKPAKKDDKKE